MTHLNDLLDLPADASADQIETAYQRKRAEYRLPTDAPADLQHLAIQRLHTLDAAYADHHAPAAPKRGPWLTRREWLYTGAGVLLALVLLAAVAYATRDVAVQSGWVAVVNPKPVPDLTLQTLDGTSLRLTDLRGKPVLVNFWATWCEPCKAETPDLVQAYKEIGDQLHIVGISIDQPNSRDEVRRFIQRYGVPYPVVLDLDNSAQRAFNIFPIPVSYIVDSQGVIRYTRNSTVTRADIQQVLDDLEP